MRALVLGVLLVGCASTPAVGPDRDDPAAAPDLSRYHAVFEIRWNGAPVGAAHERLQPAAGSGFRFERRESWRVRRGAAVVTGEVETIIGTAADLEPSWIAVRGSGAAGGTARRQGDRWRIEVEGEPPRTARGLPIELLPLIMARRGQASWSGPVLLPALGFAEARAVVEPDGEDGRWVHISGPAGILAIRVSLAPDRTVTRAIGPDLSAHRVLAAAPPQPPDLVALGALEVAGDPAGAIELETASGRRLLLAAGRPVAACRAARCAPAVPDPIPSPALGRLAARLARGAGSPEQEIARLARGTADYLVDDLAAGADPDAARVAARRRADCVGHAALFSALARARGHQVRLVTGYRLDGRRLVRHAWAVVLLGDRTLAVDPTSGEPTDQRYLPLTLHGSATAEIALASELAYAGLTAARARFIAPRSARSTPRTP